MFVLVLLYFCLSILLHMYQNLFWLQVIKQLMTNITM